jgi:uncharacterized pyridoxamine 5'-phosphate oxidase family protein
MKTMAVMLAVAGFVAAAGAAETEKKETEKTEVKQEALTMQGVHDFIKKCGFYFIATAEEDQPRVRPFGTVAIFEGKLYIQTGKKKNVAKQLAKNPKFELCAYSQAEGRWLRLAATAVADERVEARQFMLDQYPSLKKMYKADDDNTLVLYLKDATATFASFASVKGEPQVVRW